MKSVYIGLVFLYYFTMEEHCLVGIENTDRIFRFEEEVN